jgi:hypothetical protein
MALKGSKPQNVRLTICNAQLDGLFRGIVARAGYCAGVRDWRMRYGRSTYDFQNFQFQFSINNNADQLNYAGPVGNCAMPSADRALIVSTGVKL